MKYIFLLIFLTSCIFCSNAQYRNYKKDYNLKTYTYLSGDRYNPSTAALLAIVPGAGHIYVDQPLRGIIFPAGMIVSSYIMVSGSLNEWAAGWGNENKNSGEFQMIAGLAGFIGFYIGNFVDVIRIAKIKNQYYRKNDFSFQVIPFIENKYNYCFNSNAAGLTLKLKF